MLGDWAKEYHVGDLIEAAVNHPGDNDALIMGDVGHVARIRRGSVLVDWHVQPSHSFHRGNDGEFSLPRKTGWWIYKPQYIRPVEDKVYDMPDIDVLFE